MKNSFVPPATGIHTHTCVAYLKGTIYNIYIYVCNGVNIECVVNARNFSLHLCKCSFANGDEFK